MSVITLREFGILRELLGTRPVHGRTAGCIGLSGDKAAQLCHSRSSRTENDALNRRSRMRPSGPQPTRH